MMNDSNNVIELFEDDKLWREHEAKRSEGARSSTTLEKPQWA